MAERATNKYIGGRPLQTEKTPIIPGILEGMGRAHLTLRRIYPEMVAITESCPTEPEVSFGVSNSAVVKILSHEEVVLSLKAQSAESSSEAV